ncbi:MAG: single-stranded DNA-binding protein [Lachnospiraceae bacterium]|nr:single-stranded DNA-binding protein [Lachnospiraceae bacterium]MCM1239027.1 single-stranded DNA-binding protein [Lachnospiraceae bacterium]
MAQMFAFGRVENDLAPKKSQRDSTYVCFGLTEQIGKGQFQYYQVWAWGDDVSRLSRLGVKKGSQLWITGSLQLVDCTVDHGKNKTKTLKVYLSNFGFVPGRSSTGSSPNSPDDPETMCAAASSPMEVLDGERESLPE